MAKTIQLKIQPRSELGSRANKRRSEEHTSELQSLAHLVCRLLLEKKKIDAKIQQHAKNWDLGRMAVVDRNILRLAVYEMLHRTDIPPVVSINEAVDIAKRFSTDESGRFVNGILDKIKGDLMRPARVVKS